MRDLRADLLEPREVVDRVPGLMDEVVARTTLEDISVNALPFVFVSVLVVFLIAYFPALTLWLPDFLETLFQ